MTGCITFVMGGYWTVTRRTGPAASSMDKKITRCNMSSCDKYFIQHDSLIVKGMPLFLLFYFWKSHAHIQ